MDSDSGESTSSVANESLAIHLITDEHPLFPVSASLVVLLSVLYGLIAVIAVVGNAMVIAAIFRHRHMQTVTNFFIANLSIADELIGIFSIPFQFQAALLQHWNLPVSLCSLAPFVKELSVTVSVCALVVISVDRYLAVLRPLKAQISVRSAVGVMSVVWTVAFVSALPSAMVFHVVDQPFNHEQLTPDDRPMRRVCVADFPRVMNVDSGAVYRLMLAVVQYFMPLGIISFTYVRVMHHVWLSKTPGTAQDTRDRVINRRKKKVRVCELVIALKMSCFGDFVNVMNFYWSHFYLYNYIRCS